jgi:acyl carrier protein
VKNDVSKELDFKELQQLAAEILGVDVADVELDKSFAKDLAADSLDLVELIAAVEDKYDVELSEERLETMKNIGDLWTFLEEERAGGSPSAQAKKQEV